jgi:hypothetical protein
MRDACGNTSQRGMREAWDSYSNASQRGMKKQFCFASSLIPHPYFDEVPELVLITGIVEPIADAEREQRSIIISVQHIRHNGSQK